MSNRTRSRFWPIALLAFIPAHALAQNQPKQPIRISKPPAGPATKSNPAQTPPPPKPKPQPQLESVTLTTGAVEMSDKLLKLDALGLSMSLPIGAIAQTNTAADRASAQITPPAGDTSWLINIQAPRSRDKNQTSDYVAQKVLDQLLASVGEVDRTKTDREGNVIEKLISTRGKIIEPVKRVVIATERSENQRPAARFYVSLPRGEKDTSIVRGYTVFQTAPGEFVTMELATPEPSFEKARPIYEATIATARFIDATSLMAARGAVIQAGVAFLARTANPEYEAAIAQVKDQYYRLCKPAPTGADRDATEIAYRHMTARKGPRGEIDPNPRREKWTAVEREEGYLVRIDARYLQDKVIIDTIGIYWMSTNRKQEAWTLQQTMREPGKKPLLFTEVGAREGDQMSVTHTGTGTDNTRFKCDVPREGYITQVESFLLPALLTQRGAAGDYGFYVFQSRTEKADISLRRDSLAQATDGSENWVLTTQLSENTPAHISTYTSTGDLIRTVLPVDKNVWTPTTLQSLADIWKSKNLPMD